MLKIFALVAFLMASVASAATPVAPYKYGTYLRNAYASTNVTTSAWVQLTSSLTVEAAAINTFDTSGQTLILGVGAAGSEVTYLIIEPGGSGFIPIFIPRGSRVALKALSGTASSGSFDITFFKM